MAGRKKVKKATSRSSTPSRTKKDVRREGASGGLSDYFRFSESYTSLILGIVVVVIAAVLLISFVRGSQFRNTPPPAPEISSTKIEPDPTSTPVSGTPEQPVSITAQPTVTEQVASPTITRAVTVTPTVTPAPKTTPKQPTKGTYTVKAGDDLWKIAEEQYKDGYKWTLIAQANSIANPSMIFSGDVLKIPAVSEKPSDTGSEQVPAQDESKGSISGGTYTIQPGDTLWSIAEKRYNNGYRWVDIAKANSLTNPGLIHANNVLKLPN